MLHRQNLNDDDYEDLDDDIWDGLGLGRGNPNDVGIFWINFRCAALTRFLCFFQTDQSDKYLSNHLFPFSGTTVSSDTKRSRCTGDENVADQLILSRRFLDVRKL